MPLNWFWTGPYTYALDGRQNLTHDCMVMFCFIDSCLKAERDDRSEHAPSRLWSEILYFVRAFKSRSVWATWSAVRGLFMSWPLQAVFEKKGKMKELMYSLNDRMDTFLSVWSEVSSSVCNSLSIYRWTNGGKSQTNFGRDARYTVHQIPLWWKKKHLTPLYPTPPT